MNPRVYNAIYYIYICAIQISSRVDRGGFADRYTHNTYNALLSHTHTRTVNSSIQSQTFETHENRNKFGINRFVLEIVCSWAVLSAAHFFFVFWHLLTERTQHTMRGLVLSHTHKLTHRSSSWLSRSPAPSLHLFLSLSFSRTHTQSDCFKHQAIVSLSSFQSKKKFILSVGSGQCGHIYYNITETS